MKNKNDDLNKEIEEHFGGNLLSKILFRLSWVFLILFPISFFARIQVYNTKKGVIVSSKWSWKLSVGCLILWFLTAYLSYYFTNKNKKPLTR